MGLPTRSFRCIGRRLRHRLYAATLLAVISCCCTAAPRSVELYLSESPPLSTLGPMGLEGIVGEVTARAAALAGYELLPKSVPWNRGQRIAQSGVDKLIIPLSRTPDRENKYTWIAPIMTMDRAFFSLGKPYESFEQARQSHALIAVGMGSAQEQKLRDEGFANDQILALKIGDNPAQILLLGRADAWFNGVPESQYIWRKFSNQPLRMSPPLMRSDLYLACSKNCDPAMVAALRKAVETLRRDGTIGRIIGEYGENAP